MLPYYQDMALLSETENLICEARKSSDDVLRSAYEMTENYFKARAKYESKKEDDYKYFRFLYCRNHKGTDYRYIAKYILFTSVSTLEDRRALFKNIFLYYLDFAKSKAKLLSEAAVTKNE